MLFRSLITTMSGRRQSPRELLPPPHRNPCGARPVSRFCPGARGWLNQGPAGCGGKESSMPRRKKDTYSAGFRIIWSPTQADLDDIARRISNGPVAFATSRDRGATPPAPTDQAPQVSDPNPDPTPQATRRASKPRPKRPSPKSDSAKE